MNLFGYEIKRKGANKGMTSELQRPYSSFYSIKSVETDSIIGRFAGYAGENLYTIYKEISEVQYPINFIVERAKKPQIVIKSFKTDEVVWNNERLNKLLENVNPYYSFKDYVAYSILMRLINGNSYCYAATDPIFKDKLYKYCNAFYVLPSHKVDIKTWNYNPDLYSGKSKEEIIKCYELQTNGLRYTLNSNCILHIKDNIDFDSRYLKAFSRLQSQKYPIGNLMSVYEARNVIYTKRGALGAIVSKMGDATGAVAMTPSEKKQLHDDFYANYGVEYDKRQHVISSIPIEYIQMGMSIQELEPFKETLNDAVQIAGCFQIDKELIPREDNSTFANQKTAEIKTYSDVIIPLVEEELAYQSRFMGLVNDGFYFDALWDEVAVLQQAKYERETSDKAITERCKIEFDSGLITLNDWRVKLNMEAIDNSLYDKTLLEMTDAERAIIMSLKSSKTLTIQ